MNALNTVLTASTVAPKTTVSMRAQTTWYTRPHAPDRKDRGTTRRISGSRSRTMGLGTVPGRCTGTDAASC